MGVPKLNGPLRKETDMKASNRFAIVAVAALLAGGLTIGCSGGNAADADEAAAEGASGSNSAAADSQYQAPQAQPLTVPAGTVMEVAFESELSSETSKAGDTFVATVIDPIMVNGEVAIDSGSTVTGTVVEVQSSKRIGGKSKLNLRFDTLQPADGGTETIAASFYGEGQGQTKKDAATIGGATAGGALLGRLIGDNNGSKSDGTKIGAVVGAAIGTAIAANNEGEPVVIGAGTVLPIQLDSPVTL